ncbi:hypothetical protein ACIPW5_23940 [Streptomyces sp. NPDC090077]|uniref:hypothetical protein n=1 Tax=Streptomyces sp. NPDC090077 TaxID=3365938 RepID=UPI00382DBC2E
MSGSGQPPTLSGPNSPATRFEFTFATADRYQGLHTSIDLPGGGTAVADHIPINPCAIFQFTGDLDALEQDRTAIATAAATLRDTGANVDAEFQGLASFYSAPEAAQLFATTHRVRTESDHYADHLEAAAKALGEFAVEARPAVARLRQLQSEATAFTHTISGDAHWKDDPKKVGRNNDLIHDVNAAAEAFWAAERACANKIRALTGKPPLTADDGTHADNTHGYTAATLNQVEDLPWGSQLTQSHRWYEVGHWTKSFLWDGLVMDGIVGTVRGLGTLVGWDGSDAAGQAWTGLAKLATGIALSSSPGTAAVFWNADPKAMPAWFRDSRTTMKETGKALVAWDEWHKNPARAAGAVTFNVLTTVFSGGVGTGVKSGGIAKTLSIAGQAGRLIDPMTYVGQAAGKAASLTFSKLKVGELLSNIGKTDGAFPHTNDVIWRDLPRTDAPGVTFPHPDDTVRLTDDALGRPQYYDKVTHQLLGHDHLPKQDLTTVPKGPDHPLTTTPRHHELPATVGAHTPGGATPQASGGGTPHTPGSAADTTPHNGHTEPGGGGDTGGHTESPAAGAHGDGPGTGGGPSDGPAFPHQADHHGAGTPGGLEGDSSKLPTGNHSDASLPREEPRPFERGGETEKQIRKSLRPGKPKPPDLERALANLADDPAGQEIADLIASGKFKGMTNYEQVVGGISQKENGMRGCFTQLRLASQLFDSGVRDISFEIKANVEIKPGVLTGKGTDMDVMARSADGEIYGYQFKEIEDPSQVSDKIWKDMKQLANCRADVKTFVIDTKGSLADMLASGIEKELARMHTARGVNVVLRVEDGTIMYPPGASFMPGGRP